MDAKPMMVSVDVLLTAVRDARVYAALVQRHKGPFTGHYALPGGVVGEQEALEEAAIRVLASKANLAAPAHLEQLYTFGQPGRDPRGRTLSITYAALVPPEAMDHGGTVSWVAIHGTPEATATLEGEALSLAFDHSAILGTLLQRLRGKVSYTHIAYALLPPTFTLRALQEVHETLLDRPLNKDAFRRKILSKDPIEPTGDKEHGKGHRPAALYRYLGEQFA